MGCGDACRGGFFFRDGDPAGEDDAGHAVPGRGLRYPMREFAAQGLGVEGPSPVMTASAEATRVSRPTAPSTLRTPDSTVPPSSSSP